MDRITPFRSLTGFLMLLACLFLVALPAWSGTVDTFANPRQTNGSWVRDGAEVLQPQTEARLNQLIDRLEARNGSEIAVVTMDAVPKDQTAKTLATALFNRWGIGKADVNNGLLFLVAVDDRRLEVETGYGTETVLPDARVGRILDEQVVPRLRSGEIEAGIVAGTEAFVDVLSDADFSAEVPAVGMPDGVGIGGAITLLCWGVWGGSLLWMKGLSRRPVLMKSEGHAVFKGMLPWHARPQQLCWTLIFVGVLAVGCAVLLLAGAFGVYAPLWLSLFLMLGFIAAELGNTRLMRAFNRGPFQTIKAKCSVCGGPMRKVDGETIAAALCPAQRSTQRLGSVSF